jgi:hypothetical protein
MRTGPNPSREVRIGVVSVRNGCVAERERPDRVGEAIRQGGRPIQPRWWSLSRSVRGYGKRQPVADNATADGRAKNRRVELVIDDAAE